MRNLSRSLLVERLGGLAVSGELNVPALPSLAIVQVFYDKSFLCFGNLSGFYGQFFLAIIQVFIDKIFLAIFQVFSTKSFCQSFIFLTTNPTTYLVPQGLAERSGLKGEVLARAAPSSTSQVESKTTTTTSQVVPNTITTTSQVVPKPLGIHHYNNNKCYNSIQGSCFHQMAALFTGRDSSGLGLRRAPSLSKLSRAPSLSKLARNFKGSSMD